MTGPVAFDVNKYLKEQTVSILERMELFGNKLYLEFGGKLIFDYHASRVLPGFDPNIKLISFSASMPGILREEKSARISASPMMWTP